MSPDETHRDESEQATRHEPEDVEELRALVGALRRKVATLEDRVDELEDDDETATLNDDAERRLNQLSS